MPRKYIRKTERGVGGKYSSADLSQAIGSICNGTLNTFQASKRYNIPYATLTLKVKGWKGKKDKPRATNTVGLEGKCIDGGGRHPDLTIEDEKDLANHLRIMTKWGFGLTVNEILDVVQVFVKKNKLSTRFQDGKPGRDWLRRFMKDHKLSLKKPEKVEAQRYQQEKDPFVIYGFLDLVADEIRKNELIGKPEHIYNADETSFCHDPSNTKVVAGIGEAARRNTQGSGRDNTTVLACGNAAGQLLPPCIVFKGKDVWSKWMSPDGYPETSYQATDNGWMTATVFTSWFKYQFLKHIPQERRPIILIYDGHVSHLSIDLVKIAMEEQVVIIKLPPHTSHILQPMDVSVFRGVKVTWEQQLTLWQRKNVGKKLGKDDFSTLIGKLWHACTKDDSAVKLNIISGFKACGIYDYTLSFPVNKSAIDNKKFDPLKYERYLKEMESREMSSDANKSTIEDSTSTNADNQILRNVNHGTSPGRQSTGSPGPEHLSESYASTSSDAATSPMKHSFQTLLLERVQCSAMTKRSGRKRTNTAECITREEYLKQMEEDLANAAAKKKKKRKERPTNKKSKNPKKHRFVIPEINSEDFARELARHFPGHSDEDTDVEINEDAIQVDVPSAKELKVNDFVLTQFKGGKRKTTKYTYVSIIQDIIDDDDETEYKCLTLRCQSEDKKVFSASDEIVVVPFSDIIGKLPQPSLKSDGTRLKYVFEQSVCDVYEAA